MKFRHMAANFVAKVKLTTHAVDRFYEYYDGSKKYSMRKIKMLVAKGIAREIRSGIPVDRTGAMHIPVMDNINAVVLCKNNGFVIVTFHQNEKDNQDLEERKERYHCQALKNLSRQENLLRRRSLELEEKTSR